MSSDPGFCLSANGSSEWRENPPGTGSITTDGTIPKWVCATAPKDLSDPEVSGIRQAVKPEPEVTWAPQAHVDLSQLRAVPTHNGGYRIKAVEAHKAALAQADTVKLTQPKRPISLGLWIVVALVIFIAALLVKLGMWVMS